jgi:oligoribonuclease
MAYMTRARLLWVDLEMTGLDPEKDKIVEVAAIATDFEFNEVARYTSTVRISLKADEHWLADGFWSARATERDKLRAQIASSGKTTRTVETNLLKFLGEHFAKVGDVSTSEQKQIQKKQPNGKETDLAPVYLAGNSIHQDQKFIEREWPRLNKLLHYRQLDVSAWKIIFEARGVKFTKPETHRALADIEGSIAELNYYLKKVKF